MNHGEIFDEYSRLRDLYKEEFDLFLELTGLSEKRSQILRKWVDVCNEAVDSHSSSELYEKAIQKKMQVFLEIVAYMKGQLPS